MIAEIDTVKNTYSLTNRLLPQTLKRLTQSVIVTSTGASNRIEGNRLTDDEVEALYRNLRIKSFKTRDEQEVAGYIDMLARIFENHADMPVTENHILQLHQDMLAYSDKDQGHKGRYKIGPNRVEAKDQSGQVVGIIFDPTPPHLTATEMRDLNGYAFTTLVSHEKLIETSKADYYLALNKTQRTWKSEQEDLSSWLLYLFEIFLKQARAAQQILESDQFEYLLSEKQLAFWQWAQSQGSKEFNRGDAIKALGFPPRTIEQIMKKFLDMKKLQQLGQGRATRYRLHLI